MRSAPKLPSLYSSDHSLIDAKALSNNLSVKCDTIPINEIFDASMKTLEPSLGPNRDIGITEENMQARIRALILLALSNKFGYLLLSTGNKSEYSVGYATIYGDMAGGFSPLKDVYKTQVYRLANWRNKNIPENSKLRKTDVIPVNSINKEPSAELKPNQKDQDTLPSYEILDKILYLIIENNLMLSEIVNMGFNKELVYKVADLLKVSEYKRRQSAIGPKISEVNLSKDRRYPITNGFKNE
jgi:NAD+ synthase